MFLVCVLDYWKEFIQRKIFATMTESKTNEGFVYQSSSSLQFDIAVNPKEVRFGNGNQVATLTGKNCTIRGPFWSHGRHIVNLHVPKANHVGLGIVNKLFKVGPGTYVGQCANSYGTWDNGVALHLGAWDYAKTNKNGVKTKDGDIVTIDVDLDKSELNFAINGQYFSDGPIFSNIPKEVALAVSLWVAGNSVEILQYNFCK
eukprot:487320_1